MMGIKVPQEKLFYDFSLSKRVPEDHLLRYVSRVVDLSFVRNLTKPYYSHTGQPSIDPVVLFKMMVIGYLYGITSERRLAEEISLNLAYMWFLGYDIDENTPNHSVISKARARYNKEVFEQFFKHILSQCIKAGLVAGKKVFIDSTIVQANASIKSATIRDISIEAKFTPKEYVERLFAENPVEEDKGTNDPSLSLQDNSSTIPGINHRSSLEKQIMPSKISSTNNQQFSLAYEERQSRKAVNAREMSKTDPEASLYRRPGERSKFAYKSHVGIDAKGRVITSCIATPASIVDEYVIEGLIKKHKEVVGYFPDEVGADKKYGCADVYRFLLDKRIKPSIPIRKRRKGRKIIDREKFKYDLKTDSYICPEGNKLKRATEDWKHRRSYYKCERGICKICKREEECSSACKGRIISRPWNEEATEQAKIHLSSPEARQTIKERSIYCETIFGEAKTLHGLNRAKYRGLTKMQIQVLLTSSVQNIKRLVKVSIRPIEEINYRVDGSVEVLIYSFDIAIEEFWLN